MRLLILPLLLVLTAAWLNHAMLVFHQDFVRADEEMRYRRRASALGGTEEPAPAAADASPVAVAAKSGME